MSQEFMSAVGGVNINFEAIPELQPKVIRGIIKLQRLPEENVLRGAIKTVPVSDKLFKARIDDMIDLGMTPEVNPNSDDPMVSDTWRWKTDQVHEYRQAAKINREVGRQLLAPEGDPKKYAGVAELNRLVGKIVHHIDNRREFNRGKSVENAFLFDPDRLADLNVTNIVTVVQAADKWDSQTKDAQGNLVVQPFNQIGAQANRLAFISGKVPNALIVTPDVMTALENWNSQEKAGELQPAKVAGARYTTRGLQVFVSQMRKNIGTDDQPRITPLFQNMAIICSLDEETITENQYDINRVEQFTTADRLFYYVRYWHTSKVHVSRPTNFLYLKDVLAAAYDFQNIKSLVL